MRVPKWLFSAGVSFSAWINRSPKLRFIARPIMRFMGFLTLKLRGGEKKEDLESLGKEWQRMFPSKKALPITKIENETVFGEIHIKCPLQGTENVHACYRMMEYDRKLMEKIGGEFVVLRSQAEPGVQACQIAIRKKGSSTADLTPAHIRYPQEKKVKEE